MNFDDFSPENIDLRAIKVEEAFAHAAEKFYERYENDEFSTNDVDFFDDFKIDWFDVKTDILNGKTPHEYISEIWGENPDFNAALTLIKPFIYDQNYDVPSELADMVKSFPEFIDWATDFFEMLKKSEDTGDNILLISSFYTLLAGKDDDILIKKTLELMDLFEYNEINEAFFDSAAVFLALSENGIKAITEKSNSEMPSDKTFTLLTSAASSEHKSDDLYAAIRSFCKRATGNLTPDCYYLFLDYGDPRAVSFLRTRAKKYYEEWLESAQTGNPDEIYRKFRTVVGLIERLGGNTEDFM